MGKKSFIIFLILVVILLLGYIFMRGGNGDNKKDVITLLPNEEKSSEIKNEVQPIGENSGWNIYKNKEYGFQLSYPTNLFSDFRDVSIENNKGDFLFRTVASGINDVGGSNTTINLEISVFPKGYTIKSRQSPLNTGYDIEKNKCLSASTVPYETDPIVENGNRFCSVDEGSYGSIYKGYLIQNIKDGRIITILYTGNFNGNILEEDVGKFSPKIEIEKIIKTFSF
ncbi:MAG: hypothetical protein LiPW41_503 [Parcubacteria group bacterium LiPW_41]|nr:MAG: hypothetical protein LiPW41_503 [Parcubacteria group bacterium LiPW_41]